MMRPSLLAILGFCSLALLAKAQENPPKHIRFLTLGERAPWREELVDGIRKGLKPPPGSEPPEVTSLVSGDQALPFKMVLRAFTPVLTMAGSTENLEIRTGEGAGAAPWLTRPKPAAPLSLGVLYRDSTSMSWNNPQILLLKDDEASFRPGQMRFVNVSEKLLKIRLAPVPADPTERPQFETFAVEPGKVVIKPIQEGLNRIMVNYVEQGLEGGKRLVWDNQFRVLSSQRVNSFFYKAQDAKATGPVRYRYAPEPMPKLPRPPKPSQ
ncbi:hypothetical protein N9062_03285 [Akkermansiaceae bacterium]|nr:hypothetical protein [Akkermansiaceae bacterium]MDA7929832.1 hypothetical protein [Akkermansiaceae bacterium]MDA7934297.1 hypothetical protein [Akkermansiaceae bacterium]MDB4510007.1 hypothetical protein [Akkermansiaceae bacterium]